MTKVNSYIWMVFALILFGCDSENAWDCVQKPGTKILFEIPVEEFHSVTVQDHVDLVLIQDTLTRVKIETGKNLANNIQLSTVNGMLHIEEKSTCNILKNRSNTTVFIYANELYTIRNASTGTVKNEGIWRQNKVNLIAENYLNPSYRNNGEFYMNLEVQELNVLTNGHSFLKLEGSAEKASISFYTGNTRLDASTMPIQEIEVYHLGTNHMLLYPVQAIRGEILNTGDVRIYNVPPIVEVDEKYLGSLVVIE